MNLHNLLNIKLFNVLLVAVLLLGAAPVRAEGNGDEASARAGGELGEFDRIQVAGAYELHVQVGGKYAVNISGSDRALGRLNVHVDDGTLVLDQNKEFADGFHLESLKATITMPRLKGVEVKGFADVEIEGIDADTFDAELGGAAAMELSGRCGALNARLSGIGELDAKALRCKRVEVRVSGIGAASAYASEVADVKSTGIGGIDIYGSPPIVNKDASPFSGVTIH